MFFITDTKSPTYNDKVQLELLLLSLYPFCALFRIFVEISANHSATVSLVILRRHIVGQWGFGYFLDQLNMFVANDIKQWTNQSVQRKLRFGLTVLKVGYGYSQVR